MIVQNHGDPASPIWLIYDQPFSTDVDRGYILSGGLGFIHRKTWELSGLPQPYIYVMKPCIGASYDYNTCFSHLIRDLSSTSVPFILPTSVDLLEKLCPDLVTKSQRKAILKKYAGNLLSCSYLNWPHYVIPQYPADFVGANFDYHEIQAFIDLGHVKEEWEYWSHNNAIKPLPARQLITEPNYEDLLSFMYRCRYDWTNGAIQYISVDIETIRPQKGSYYAKINHPGYPYTISIALNPYYGISFSLWDYPSQHLTKIWRELDALLRDIPQIGQNYFSFDSHWLTALGFRINCLEKCQDTLIRHHILWPGLRHALQFQTKQYTRQPYYKDEGKQWTPKHKRSLMHYNALDSTVTYEIYLAQELEFAERPHLR